MSSRRWNPITRKWDITYTAAKRNYPPLSSELEKQLRAIEPTHDGYSEYFPCAVLLSGSEQHDRVYLADATSFIQIYGAWPDDDATDIAIPVERVVQIQKSPYRLPLKIAREIYSLGERGISGRMFALEFADGSRQHYHTANLTDFLELPLGQALIDIVAVTPDSGAMVNAMTEAPYQWCLFASKPRQSALQRLAHALRFG